ncbi:hypothetical protein CEXT_705541 [Caerostris extrusa]|uniref:Uncharacterized protein n=1 Tax=Caerostris extrusa TaxID=172846 RepID=A0AAV4Q5H2_CAEEX|nr:hypothetical protein CEXT_705541 [Caerostris extrusa]
MRVQMEVSHCPEFICEISHTQEIPYVRSSFCSESSYERYLIVLRIQMEVSHPPGSSYERYLIVLRIQMEVSHPPGSSYERYLIVLRIQMEVSHPPGSSYERYLIVLRIQVEVSHPPGRYLIVLENSWNPILQGVSHRPI